MDEKMSRKPFVREVPKVTWFFDHPRYMRYMARELTCLFIGAYTMLLVVGLARLAQGREAYEAFLTALQAPGSLVFHGLALVFAGHPERKRKARTSVVERISTRTHGNSPSFL